MLIPGQLPTLEVLIPASRMFNVKICTYFWSDRPVIFQFDSDCVTPLFIQCLGGIHFNALVPLEEFSCNFTFSEIHLHLFKSNQPKLHCGLLGKQFCAVLDTGAEISLITESVLDMLGTEESVRVCEDRFCDIVGLNGRSIPITKTVCLRLSIGSFTMKTDHKFAVVKSNVLPCCLLVGIDFMLKNGFTLNFNLRTCIINGETICTFESGKLNSKLLNAVCMVKTNLDRTFHNLVIESDINELRFKLEGDHNFVTGLNLLIDSDTCCLLQTDRQLVKLKRSIRNKPLLEWDNSIKEFRKYSDGIKVVDGILVYNNIMIAPFKVVVDLVITLHARFAHVGRDKLLNLLKSLVWHPMLYKIASDVATTCPECQIFKCSSAGVSPPVLKIKSCYPFELMAADMILLPRNARGYMGCLVVVDHYSKWVSAVPVKDKTSATVSDALVNKIFPFMPMVPTRLLTDNGPEFSAAEFKSRMSAMGVRHQFTTPNHPSSNGAVERVNRTIQTFIRSLTERASDWDLHLGTALITYNNTTHSELDMSPSRFLLTVSHGSFSLPLLDVNSIQEYWRESRTKFVTFTVGQWVLMKVPRKGNLVVDKFTPRYKGPYKVTKVNPNGVTYELQHGSRTIRAHHSDLHLYKRVPKYIENHEWYRYMARVNFDPPDEMQSENTVDSGNKLPLVIVNSASGEDDSSEFESTGDELLVHPNDRHSARVREKEIARIKDPALCFCCSYERKRETRLSLRAGKCTSLKIPGSANDKRNLSFRDNVMPTINPGQEIIRLEKSPSMQEDFYDEIFAGERIEDECEFWEVSPATCGTAREFDGEDSSGCSAVNDLWSDGSIVESENVIDNYYDRLLNERLGEKRRHTRSIGPVPEYPNVQRIILERKRKSSMNYVCDVENL